MLLTTASPGGSPIPVEAQVFADPSTVTSNVEQRPHIAEDVFERMLLALETIVSRMPATLNFAGATRQMVSAVLDGGQTNIVSVTAAPAFSVGFLDDFTSMQVYQGMNPRTNQMNALFVTT